MEQLSKKVKYCLEMMDTIKWFSYWMPNDYLSRIFARMFFVYLDSYLDLISRLKNMIRKEGIDVKQEHSEILRLNKMYEEFFSVIRDKVGAHRQDMEFVELIEKWNDLTNMTIKQFFVISESIYSSLANKQQSFMTYTRPVELCATNKKLLIEYTKSLNKQIPVIAVDNLALTRPNTATIIPTHELQTRGTMLISIIEMIEIEICLYHKFKEINNRFERLLKSMIIVDLFSIIDNLWGSDKTKYKPEIKGYYKVCEEIQHKGFHILHKTLLQRNILLENYIKIARNKYAAHIDTKNTIEKLFKLTDRIKIDFIIKIFIPLKESFNQANKLDIRTKILLIHGNELKGVHEVKGTGSIKKYKP
ncbi:hypothetical protein ACFTQL_20380 [Peribacillus butanolivorans]|uniref:hypothetical protein n=1 Tax=Peribacillus butanolivorans TaxID=421767 RepID=UPI00363EABEB